MDIASKILSQIELAAHDAPGPMLRTLIGRTVETIESAPEESGEYGQFLLLKLNHLLTQQQVLEAHRNGAGRAYLAPNLVIEVPMRKTA